MEFVFIFFVIIIIIKIYQSIVDGINQATHNDYKRKEKRQRLSTLKKIEKSQSVSELLKYLHDPDIYIVITQMYATKKLIRIGRSDIESIYRAYKNKAVDLYAKFFLIRLLLNLDPNWAKRAFLEELKDRNKDISAFNQNDPWGVVGELATGLAILKHTDALPELIRSLENAPVEISNRTDDSECKPLILTWSSGSSLDSARVTSREKIALAIIHLNRVDTSKQMNHEIDALSSQLISKTATDYSLTDDDGDFIYPEPQSDFHHFYLSDYVKRGNHGSIPLSLQVRWNQCNQLSIDELSSIR